MLEIGLSTCGKVINEKLFYAYSEAGISCMEIAVSPAEYDALDMKRIRALADGYGVTLWSYHLPFLPFDRLDISRRDLAPYTVEYLSGLICRAAEVGVDKFVVHPSGEPIADAERTERMSIAMESLSTLAERAFREGAVIAVEDLPRSCLGRDSSDILTLLSADDRLRVCFDTNHLLYEDNLDFIRRVGSKIITTHVSDYDFIDEKHWLPGEGEVDFTALARELTGVGYRGAWLYEVAFTAPDTLIRPRELNCLDFASNAKQILSGQKPAVIGKRK